MENLSLKKVVFFQRKKTPFLGFSSQVLDRGTYCSCVFWVNGGLTTIKPQENGDLTTINSDSMVV